MGSSIYKKEEGLGKKCKCITSSKVSSITLVTFGLDSDLSVLDCAVKYISMGLGWRSWKLMGLRSYMPQIGRTCGLRCCVTFMKESWSLGVIWAPEELVMFQNSWVPNPHQF